MKVLWTKHAEQRQKEWQQSLGITRQEVEDLVKDPDQVVPGDLEALVAQARRGHGLLRVPFLETIGGRKILTVYWTSKVKKYWREEQDADPV